MSKKSLKEQAKYRWELQQDEVHYLNKVLLNEQWVPLEFAKEEVQHLKQLLVETLKQASDYEEKMEKALQGKTKELEMLSDAMKQWQAYTKSLVEENEKVLTEKEQAREIVATACDRYLTQFNELKGKVEAHRKLSEQIQIALAQSFHSTKKLHDERQLDLQDWWEIYERAHNYFLEKIRELVEVFGNEKKTA